MDANPVKDRDEARLDERDGVRAVHRAIAVLQSFTPAQPTLSVLEMQARTGLSRPTLYRLLQALEAGGMVRAEGEPRRWSLGPTVMTLAQVWMATLDVRRLAQPLLEALRDVTGETAGLFLLRDGRRICVAECISRQVLAMTRGLGETEHITRGASGRAMLAFAPPGAAWAEAALANPMADADHVAVLAELEATRRRGFALSRGEVFRGAIAIAAPVFDHGGTVCGAIALYGPEARLPRGQEVQAAAHVTMAAAKLSSELGYTAVPR